jgi:protein SCO1
MFKNISKTGILLAILGVPAFVFIFLKIFGKNNFDLPYYFPKIGDNGQVVISKGDTLFNQVPDFELLDQDSLQYSSKTNSGKIRVVSFFFSRCGTICPTTNENLNRILENFKAIPEFEVESITVDPIYDTPSVLKKYASQFDNSKGNWHFLTGDKSYIYNLAIKGFKLPVADATEYDSNITNIDETFIHSDKLLLIDQDGYFRGIYTGTDKFEIDRLMVEVKVLITKLDDGKGWQ